jgi:LacI family transcriptional regulator
MESPLVEALAQSLRQDIAAGKLPAGKPLPPERDLAETMGVSRAMIRKAVSLLAEQGHLRVQPNCRPVVLSPSTPQGSPPGTRSSFISVGLWPHADDITASLVFRGLQKALSGSELNLMISLPTSAQGQSDDIAESEAAFIRNMADDPACVGAVIWLLGGERSASAIAHARERNVPLVFLDRLPPGDDADFVGSENVNSSARVVRHLVVLGHERIVCVADADEVSTVRERIAGYRRALEEAGLPYSEDLVYRHRVEAGESEASAIDRLVSSLMSQASPPTAIFAINDSTALSLIDRLEKAGFSVPRDVSVAGFDGLLRWVPGGGSLTTAVQDFYRMGELAAELLLQRIRQGESKTCRQILLDAPLSVQASTASPRQNHNRGKDAASFREST